MKRARYWTTHTVEGRGKDNSPFSVRCRGWSNQSFEDAVRLAGERAERVLARLQSGTLDRREPYAYGDRPIAEETLSELNDDSGASLAVITRNSQGAMVLNTEDMMFVDIDLPSPGAGAGSAMNWIAARLTGRKIQSPEEAAIDRARSFAREKRLCGRIYRTRGGLRLLITNRTFNPASRESEEILNGFSADPKYVDLCKAQECFRARLTPKPYRCGLESPKVSFPFEQPGDRDSFQAWTEQYTQAIGEWATCAFVAPLGSTDSLSRFQPLIELHDRETGCQRTAARMSPASRGPIDTLVLINAASGAGQGELLFEYLAKQEPRSAVRVLRIEWSHLEDQLTVARNARQLIIAGGDGTFSALLPQLIGAKTSIALAALGTGNDLARELAALRRGKLEAALSNSESVDLPGRDVTIWKICSSANPELVYGYFVNYLSFGFSARVIQAFDERRRGSIARSRFQNRLRYLQLGLQHRAAELPQDLTVSAPNQSRIACGPHRQGCLVFSNISSWMGLARIQASDPFDELLEVTRVYSPFSYLRSIAAGAVPRLTLPLLGRSRVWRVSGIGTQSVANRDGEPFYFSSSSVEISPAGKVTISAVFEVPKLKAPNR